MEWRLMICQVEAVSLNGQDYHQRVAGLFDWLLKGDFKQHTYGFLIDPNRFVMDNEILCLSLG